MAGTFSTPAPLMPWHVLSTALWLALLVSQPILVRRNGMNLHRLFGSFGVLVAISVIITGVVVQIEVMGPYATQKDTPNAVFTPFFRLVTMLIYMVCISIAVALRRRPDWHKRLMILGTFSLLEAPISRLFKNVFGLPEIAGFMAANGHILLMVVFLIWDRRRRGRFHPAAVWGTILSTLIVFGTAPIAFTERWRGIAAWLAGI
jgi:uncharacterized membrane protein